MNIFDIFAAASFKYAIYLNLAATELLLNCAVGVVLRTCVIIAFLVAYHVVVAK